MKTKRCKHCKVPLEGMGLRLIARPLFGVRPSRKRKGYCNKCENEK